MFTFTVTAETLDELEKKVIKALGIVPAQQELPGMIAVNDVEQTVKAEPAPKAAKPKKEKPVKEEKPAASFEPVAGEQEQTAPVAATLDECKTLLRRVVTKDTEGGDTEMTTAKNLLANFGIKKLVEMDAKHYPAFASAARTALGE